MTGAPGTTLASVHPRLDKPTPTSLIGLSTPPFGTLADHRSRIDSIAIHDDRLYATHYFGHNNDNWNSPGPGNLVVLDRVSLAEAHPRVPVGWTPAQVLVNPTAGRIYVVNRGAGSRSISVIGLDSLEVESEIPIGTGLVGAAVDASANILYTLNHTSGKIVAFNCNNHSIIAEITVGAGIGNATVDEAGRWLYVTQSSQNPAALYDQIWVVDTSTHQIDQRPGVINPIVFPPQTRLQQIVHYPRTDRLLVLNQGVQHGPTGGSIEIDATTRVVTSSTFLAGPTAIDVDPFRGLVHMIGTNNLHSQDIATHTVLAADTFAGQRVMRSVAVDPETSTVAIGDDHGVVTLVHPSVAFGDAPQAPPGAPMTIVTRGGELSLFTVGSDDRARTVRWSDATDWDFTQGWIDLPDSVPAQTPLAGINRQPDQWEIYAVRADQQLWALAGDSTGATRAWQPMGGRFPLRAPIAAVSRYQGHRLVFAVGEDGVVASVGGEGDATDMTLLDGGPPLRPGSPIAAVSRKRDQWDLFVLAADGQVWTRWWSSGAGLSAWGTLGGSFPQGTPITVVSRGPRSLDLFAVRDDGQVVTQYWHSKFGWSGWAPVTTPDDPADNAAPIRSVVTGVGRNGDSLDIVVVRADQQIYTARWEDEWSRWRPIGGRVAAPGSPLALAARTDQWMYLCWAAEGGSVETSWWNRVQPNGGWSLDNGIRLQVPTESARFFTEVVTDTSKLSGQIVTRLWRSGAALISGHVHGSGWDPYRFTVQASLWSETGFSIANLHRGRVDGTGSEPLPTDDKPDRDNWWNDCGHDAVVEGAYTQLATTGDPTASLISKNIGIGGGIVRLFEGALGTLDKYVLDPARTLTQLVSVPGTEFNNLMADLTNGIWPVNFQSVFVNTGALGWLNGGQAMVPILPWDAELGTAFDPFVDHRPIKQHEYDFADRVFRGSLPSPDQILLTDATGVGKRKFVFPVSADGPFIMNLGAAYEDPVNYADDTHRVPGQVFIHEMTHVWHVSNTTMSPRDWLIDGIVDREYEPPDASTLWRDFGIEQKASTVDRWFRDHVQEGLDSHPALNDPYYPFIHLVRTRVTGD